jgi:hypothetical protein
LMLSTWAAASKMRERVRSDFDSPLTAAAGFRGIVR